MILTLEVVGEQAEDLGASGRKVFHAVGGTIGRLPDNDWVFPDPYVSGRHALIRYLGGKFFVEDTSTNGVFINTPDNRLQKAQPHPLKHGDLLYIDAYRINVTIESEQSADASMDTFSILKKGAAKAAPPPVAAAPPPAPPPPVQAAPVATPMARTPSPPPAPPSAREPAPSRSSAAKTPPRNKEPPSPQETVFLPPPDEDHTVGLSGAVDDQRTEWIGAPKSAQSALGAARGPASGSTSGSRPGPLIDDQKTQWIGVENAPAVDDQKTEWFGRSGGSPQPEEPPPPPPRQRATPLRPAPVVQQPAPVPPVSVQPAAPPPPPPVVVSALPKPAPAPAPVVRPAPPPPPSPAVEPPTPAPVARERVPERQAAPAPPRVSGGARTDDALMRELLAAAGIVGVEPSVELAQTMGEILRVAVSGLMEVQRARERMKDELRVRGTIFKPAHNNPLKFSANVEDAFHNLLIKHNAAYLDPTHAFEDAFHDVRDHHSAILGALRLAFESMLAQFDPTRMQEEFDRQMKKGSILGVPVKLRYWDLYRDRYGDMVKDADTSFRHLFGDKFANEYEEQLDRLKAQNRDRDK